MLVHKEQVIITNTIKAETRLDLVSAFRSCASRFLPSASCLLSSMQPDAELIIECHDFQAPV